MLIINAKREELIKCLPFNNTVCEIGVDHGYFSDVILKNSNPNKLHLIDPWCHIPADDYIRDTVNVNDYEQDVKYRNVLNRFSNNIRNGQVIVHRDFSYNVMKSFNDKYFDWIYVDGMHTYPAVLNDLTLCYDKMKDTGFIIGHDFSNHEIAKYMDFGVIEAVKEFIKITKCKLLGITLESGWPSFIIYKNYGEHVEHVIYNSIAMFENPIDIDDEIWENINFFQKVFGINDQLKYVTCLYKR